MHYVNGFSTQEAANITAIESAPEAVQLQKLAIYIYVYTSRAAHLVALGGCGQTVRHKDGGAALCQRGQGLHRAHQ